MLTAITRQVSASIGNCELSFHERQPIDVEKAIAQHTDYEHLLTELGLRVLQLVEEPNLPDAVFVEDAAVVVDEVAVICRMGVLSRRPEAQSVAAALSDYRRLEFLTEPATLDGGDVMRIGRKVFVGATNRTNAEGVAQLRNALAPFGYDVSEVSVTGCLHLKSACSYVGRDSILVNRKLFDASPLAGFELIEVPESEQAAANVLSVGNAVIVPASFPETRSMLEARGLVVRSVDVSEFQKAEGGVTCKSIILECEDEGRGMRAEG